MTTRRMIHIGRDRVQIGPWKATTDVANLVPFPVGPALSTTAVHAVVSEAQSRGFTSAYTAALSPEQAQPFLDAGFSLLEELHLLQRLLDHEIEVDRSTTRRARRADWDDILTLDKLAFDEFWGFDRASLADAIRATPRHRFHVIKTVPVAGYHVTGLAGANSYLQRVAVHPDAQGQGYGSALVNDSLRWAWRNGATLAQVNTQVVNDRALQLYERCGFTLAPHRLMVLHHHFGPAPD